jgi:uncharacterized protein (TIGR03086 family)
MDPAPDGEHAGAMETAELYRRTMARWTALVQGAPSDAWESPTPCSEWSVRDLVNHVVGEDAWTVPLMRGSTIAEVGTTLDGDLLGDDARRVALREADAALAVVADKLPAGGRVHLSYGDEDVEEYVRQLAADHLLHGWDLAAGTGQDRTMDEDLVQEVAGWFAGREELYRSAGVIGPPAESSGDAQTELLAAAGRDARWTPPQR